MQRGHSTKTDELVSRIFKAVLHGDYNPGDVIPSERKMPDIAKASRITVRRAYQRLLEMGILERRQGSGTYVAKRRRGAVNHSGVVGLLAPAQFASGVFGARFLNALEHAVRTSGQVLALRLTNPNRSDDERGAMDLALHQVRNLVIWPCLGPFRESTFERLRILGVNMVFFDLVTPGPYADFVGLDNAHAIRTLMTEAIAAGNRFFVHITHTGLPGNSTAQRKEEFLRFCDSRNLPRLVAQAPWIGDVAGTLRRHAAEWFDRPEKTAVLCVNDDVAIQARAIAGPAVDVYGIDGLPAAAAAGVVSYLQPYDRMARIALQLIRGQQEAGEDWTPRQVRCRGGLAPRPG